jgi:uncharacterized protein
MSAKQVEALKEFVRPHYTEKDPAHNFDHILRILKRIESWKKEVSPKPDKYKLAFIACFHGLRSKLRNDERFRENVVNYLTGWDWDDERIKDEFTSLYRHTENPQTIEEKLVNDANNYERLGAFGIAKAFITGGARGQTIEETADIFEYNNLDKTVFDTPMTNKNAEQGIIFAKEFLKKLRNELK